MINDIQKALTDYQTKWQGLVSSRNDQDFFNALKPTALGWKVTDLAELEQRFAELRDQCDQIHFGWVNERWIITLHLKELTLPWNLTVIKLMQRRPGSTDAVGLDHVDFYHADITKERLEAEKDLKWNEEWNETRCKWLSIWFDTTEAKLRTDTVLQVCVDEMLDIQKAVLHL